MLQQKRRAYRNLKQAKLAYAQAKQAVHKAANRREEETEAGQDDVKKVLESPLSDSAMGKVVQDSKKISQEKVELTQLKQAMEKAKQAYEEAKDVVQKGEETNWIAKASDKASGEQEDKEETKEKSDEKEANQGEHDPDWPEEKIKHWLAKDIKFSVDPKSREDVMEELTRFKSNTDEQIRRLQKVQTRSSEEGSSDAIPAEVEDVAPAVTPVRLPNERLPSEKNQEVDKEIEEARAAANVGKKTALADTEEKQMQEAKNTLDEAGAGF